MNHVNEDKKEKYMPLQGFILKELLRNIAFCTKLFTNPNALNKNFFSGDMNSGPDKVYSAPVSFLYVLFERHRGTSDSCMP